MTEPSYNCDVVVIGAGISGLTAAYYLKRAGLKVAVIDRRSRTGGVIKSGLVDGFLLEYGPNSTIFSSPMRRLIRDLALDNEVVFPGSRAKNRFLALPGQDGQPSLVRLPRGPIEALTTPVLSFWGKIRFAAEPFIGRGRRKDESVRDFITRRFGKEVAERIVDPALGGIWAADITKLSARTALARLWELEQTKGSVIWGFVKSIIGKRLRRNSQSSEGRNQIASLRRGMAQLHEALSEALSAELMLDCEVTSLEAVGEGIALRTGIRAAQIANRGSFAVASGRIEARHSLLAVDATAAAGFIGYFDKEAADFVSAVPYAPIGILHLSVAAGSCRQPLDGFGFLVPRTLGGIVLGAIYNSSLFEGRAPAGSELLTCFIGGATRPEKSDPHDAETVKVAIEEVRSLLQIDGEIRILDRTFVPQAIPNYPLGHRRTQERIAELEKGLPQFTIIGNWLRGTGVVDRVSIGIEAAEKIAARLAQA